MKILLSIALSLVFTASFIQNAEGLRCKSGCAACFKIGTTIGEDIKLLCETAECGNSHALSATNACTLPNMLVAGTLGISSLFFFLGEYLSLNFKY
jgi:hypothetical protein